MSRLEKSIYYIWGWVAKIIAATLFMTCRVSVFGQEIETKYLADNPQRGLLYASWHRGLIFFGWFYRNLQFVVMASASRDGELASQATARLGWIPVRGSSSRRGSKALKEMKALFDKGHRGGLVVDAPRGPCYVSKIGIIVLAKRTGLPLIPVMWCADRYWQLRNWDRTIIPKPFSRIVFLYHDSFLEVPPDSTEKQCEDYRYELDRILRGLMFQTDSFFSRPDCSDPRTITIPDPLPEIH